MNKKYQAISFFANRIFIFIISLAVFINIQYILFYLVFKDHEHFLISFNPFSLPKHKIVFLVLTVIIEVIHILKVLLIQNKNRKKIFKIICNIIILIINVSGFISGILSSKIKGSFWNVGNYQCLYTWVIIFAFIYLIFTLTDFLHKSNFEKIIKRNNKIIYVLSLLNIIMNAPLLIYGLLYGVSIWYNDYLGGTPLSIFYMYDYQLISIYIISCLMGYDLYNKYINGQYKKFVYKIALYISILFVLMVQLNYTNIYISDIASF